MSDQAEAGQEKPAKRGEAAWKAAKDGVAERNDQARKAGKQERQAFEARRAGWRRDSRDYR